MERKSKHLTVCYTENKLLLNISKTNELREDYQRTTRPPVLVVIQEVKRVDSYKNLRVQINMSSFHHFIL